MTHFLHIRTKNLTCGGATIAYRTQDGELSDTIEIGIARCHPRDNFNKRQGRMKAQGRLTSPNLRKYIPVGRPVNLFNAQDHKFVLETIRHHLHGSILNEAGELIGDEA